MKKLSLHFRLGVAAEGWYPTAIVGLCPAQEWWGGLAHLSEEGREGGRKREVVAVMLLPCFSHLWLALRRQEGKQMLLMQEDVGGLREGDIRQLGMA